MVRGSQCRLGPRACSYCPRHITVIERTPLQFPEVERGIRRAVIRRFPYAAYFIVDPERIAVIAIFHHRPDPARWQTRR